MTRLPRGVEPSDVVWLQNKSRPVIENTLANLRRVPSIPHWPCGTFEGTAVIVGAGPSLAHNVDDLKRHEWVLAVNTAVPALLKAGRPPDAVLIRECLDLRDHLDGLPAGTDIICDIGAHPDTFAMATGWYLSFYPRHIEMQHHLHIPGARDCGPSALTAAVATVMAMGAGEVVLYGTDLSVTDGLVYAPDSAWGGATATFEKGALCFEGVEHIKQRNESQGQQSSIPPRLLAQRCRGWGVAANPPIDAEPVYTYSGLTDQRAWLETVAERNRGFVWLVNGTRGGSHIEGWDELARESVIRDRSPVTITHEAPIPQANVEAYFDDIRKQCGVMDRICSQILDRSTPEGLALTPGYIEGGLMIEAYAAWGLFRAKQLGGRARMRGMYEAIREASEGVRGMLP